MRRDHSNWHWEWSHDEPLDARWEFFALLSLVAILLGLAGWSLYSAIG